MSTSQAKVVLDKLLKIYEPLKDAQKLLVQLDSAEQLHKETLARVNAVAAEAAKQEEARAAAEQAMMECQSKAEEIMREAETKARELVAAARNEAQGVLMQMEAAKATLQKDVDSLRTVVVMLEKDVAAKRDELASVTQSIRDYKSNLEKVVTAL